MTSIERGRRKMSATNAREFMIDQVVQCLSGPMRSALLAAQATPYGAAPVAGLSRTLDALRRRGLVAGDNRWTALGREVAAAVRGGSEDRGHVRLIDELHAEALDIEQSRNELRDELRRERVYARAVSEGGTFTEPIAADLARAKREIVDEAHAEALAEDARRSTPQRPLSAMVAAAAARTGTQGSVSVVLQAVGRPSRWDPKGALANASPATDRQLHMALGANEIGGDLLRSVLRRLFDAEAAQRKERPFPPLPETIYEAVDQLYRTARRFPGALGQRVQNPDHAPPCQGGDECGVLAHHIRGQQS